MQLPPAIFFINSDALDGYALDGYNITDGYAPAPYELITKNTLIRQLFIDEYMLGSVFDAHVLSDGYYVSNIHLLNKRIMVARENFADTTNRDLADVVLYYSHGLVKVYKNKNGPPGLTLPIDKVDIYTLLRSAGSQYVITLPATSSPPPHGLGGIVAEELGGCGGVYAPNPDNEFNNPDWINRK